MGWLLGHPHPTQPETSKQVAPKQQSGWGRATLPLKPPRHPRNFGMSSSFLIPQQCTKRFYNSVALFSKALLAPRSPGWASFVDKVPAKAGEDASFHKRGSVYTPPKMHIHTPHTCTHIPALCTHSQCTPPPRPLINMPTGTHTLRAHQPLPPHTPSSHTLYRRYTLPTHPHTPTFLTYTFHTHQHPTHTHMSHGPHPLHTHIHTHT